ncbi:Sec-independent protein translocase subunit TatB [Piscinibacter sp. SJAQ100]|uniref:Sec-independent protein translocase protein TatB n=1 Tax=Aquariibacter albus TaxID=2759899 RepID=A0A839HIS8_9BURK|nr:Sec-independent protein translocase protein TatB [Aquariibacter albus]MBB1162245.1 Sec-independent protein translocase subunit TatB [Aquariibacter albus]
MIDFGFDKLALIGAVALIVIGPEKLPKVARTVGHLLGKAQRYVADVKAEVNRSMELEELQKMRREVETAARNVEQTVQQELRDTQNALDPGWQALDGSVQSVDTPAGYNDPLREPPGARAPRKNWRAKRAAVPQWYRHRHGVRGHVQSGAARVARFRPPRPSR